MGASRQETTFDATQLVARHWTILLHHEENPMPARRQKASVHTPATIDNVAELWMLRILVPMGGHKTFLRRGSFADDAIARALGLGPWLDEERDFDVTVIRTELRDRHRVAEAAKDRLTVPRTLQANMARLAALVGLSAADCRILEFATLIHQGRLLDDCADTLGQLNSAKLADLLAQLLELDLADVRLSLGPHGVLARSGLLSVERGGTAFMRGKLDLLSASFADNILASDADPLTLLRETICPSAPARLTLGDYPHLREALGFLRPHLEQAIASEQPGVNIFLHGAPGTGKSELARALSAALGSELFEVASEDADGDPVNGERRLRAYRAAQNFFCQRHVMILFDEVEDVFSDGDNFFGRKSTAQRRKAWLNRTLEQNKVPTFWLSNSIRDIDPAFMRRFDMVIELPVPPRAQREHIVRTACGDLLDEHSIRRIAESEALAPAVVSRVGSVVRNIRHRLASGDTTSAVTWLIDQSLEAQGHAPLRFGEASHLPAEYDAALLNADTSMVDLAQGLETTRSARLCLYGPSGTGKTAYARWLAGRLDMPLLLYSASDLMSKWVGESEKQIAAAFRKAEREGAMLLIDEVDSFLQDRTRARQPWEITMVNEMLTRMEAFSGVFIASTNLMDGLDPAALRRFDLKVRFDYLRPEGAVALFERYCTSAGLALPAAGDLGHLRGLRTLTPGDFAAVMRQHRFRPLASPADFLRRLQDECSLKAASRATIGFVG
jgi:transitional endoplasmic reticulum ATPase